jgi:hypothetical protein
MKKNDTHAFVNQLLVWLLVTICSGGSIGLGTVWMRHQISITANTNRQLTDEIAKLERLIDARKSEVVREQAPAVLRQRNQLMRLGLVEVDDRRVIRVTEDPVQRLVARRNRELLRDTFTAGAIRFAALGQ